MRSLDEELASGHRVVDGLAADDEDDDPVDHEPVRRAVAALPARSRLVVERSFGLDGRPPEPLTQIAGRIGVSVERTRQVRAEALRRVRGSLRRAA
jgi:DNA-directed RNA polymerase sigma subunit (sigma70/sigma32)